jgi:mannose-6-phosphate isomerase-like protein (cupin superfamily)
VVASASTPPLALIAMVPPLQSAGWESHALSHDSFEETIYGLGGVGTWTVDREAIDIGPGNALCVAPGSTGSPITPALGIATPGVFGPA